MTGYILARIQLHECRFRLAKKKHTEFVLQCSISGQYLASKLQKVLRIPKLIYRQILNPLWNVILRKMIPKSDLSYGIARLNMWSLGWCGGKGLTKKGDQKFAKITIDSHWEILLSLLVRDWGELSLYYCWNFWYQPYQSEYFLLIPPQSFSWESCHSFWNCRMLLSSFCDVTICIR